MFRHRPEPVHLRSFIFLMVCSSSWSSRSYGPPVSVKVGSPALLTCSSPHPGDVRWTLSKQSKEFLVAECEGEMCVVGDAFENRTMIQQENTSLLLDPVAYTDAGWYICYRGGSVLCEVHLDVFAPVTISMAVGETVSLPCFVHTDQSTAGNDVLVRWEKDGKLVVKLQQEKLSYGSGFEQRVSLSASRYKDGDLSLTISTFGSSDGGVYRCYYGNNELGYPEAVVLEASSSCVGRPVWLSWSSTLVWITSLLLVVFCTAVLVWTMLRRSSQQPRAEVNALLTQRGSV